jgi:deoxycytidylate deaminase
MRPCYKCAKAIIQSGVKRVVCQYLFSDEKWDKEFEISKQMFEEAGVEYVEIK